MFGILVEGAQAIEDLLVLLVVISLGARLIDGSDEVVWLPAVILTGLGSFWPITAAIPVETTVIVAAVVVASVIGAIIVAARQPICARIFIEVHLSFLGIGVLVGGCDHLVDAYRWLAVELGTELAVMKSRTKAVMTSASVMLGIEFLISKKRLM